MSGGGGKKRKRNKFLHLHSRDMHTIKTGGFVGITEENTHEGGWVMSDSTCVGCLELVSACEGFSRWLDWSGGGSGAATQLSLGIREDHWNHFWWWRCCGAGGYGGQTLQIWFQFGVDLISLSDGSNQGFPLWFRYRGKNMIWRWYRTQMWNTLSNTHITHWNKRVLNARERGATMMCFRDNMWIPVPFLPSSVQTLTLQ